MSDVLPFLLFVTFCIVKPSEQDATLEDLKLINSSCLLHKTCPDLKHSCYADDACIEYGDCCPRADHYDPGRMIESVGKYECIRVPSANHSVYMKGKCKEGWDNQAVQKLCYKGYYGTSYENQLNFFPIFDTPFTSLLTNVTYKNYYCAVCNEESLANIEVWNPRFTCYFNSDEEYSNIEPSTLLQRSVKVNGTHSVYVNTTDGVSEFRKCIWHSFIPTRFIGKVRMCHNYVATCSLNWTDLETRKLCYSYTLMVHHMNITYRNYHCALCNYVKDNDVVLRPATGETTIESQINTLYFSPNIGWTNCSDQQIRHPYVTECVNVSNIVATVSLSCPRKRFINSSVIIKGPRLSIYDNSTNQIFNDGEYEDAIDGVIVCNPFGPLIVLTLSWIMLVGLGLSITGLTLHLLTFAFVPGLRNLGGKNVAMLCVALLSANIIFLRNVLFSRPEKVECKVVASAMYYFFFASIVWMSVVSFDIWFVLRQSTSKLRVTSGKHLKKFLFYSIYAWTLPGIALIVVVVIDYIEPSFVTKEYLPDLGGDGWDFCWLGKGNAVLFYFGIPAASIMIINLIFFLMSVGMTFSVKNTNSPIASRPLRLQLKLYGKLFVLMGLGWVVYFISEFFPFNVCSCLIFIVMFSFQGFFIFLAYTCTKKVRKYLKKKLKLTKSTKVPKVVEGNELKTRTKRTTPNNSVNDSSCSGNTDQDVTIETSISSTTYL